MRKAATSGASQRRGRLVAVFLFFLTLLAQCVDGHNIGLGPHARECFHETIRSGDKMTVSYQVGDRAGGGSSGDLDIEFWVQAPNGQYVEHQPKASSGDHSFTANTDGKYVYCFSNEGSGMSTKEVSFNVHGIIYVAEEEHEGDPLEREVRLMGELLRQVKDEQEYIILRERTHRNTAESTNSRVKWWSIFQLLVLIANCLFQIFYLRRFFEIKHVV